MKHIATLHGASPDQEQLIFVSGNWKMLKFFSRELFITLLLVIYALTIAKLFLSSKKAALLRLVPCPLFFYCLSIWWRIVNVTGVRSSICHEAVACWKGGPIVCICHCFQSRQLLPWSPHLINRLFKTYCCSQTTCPPLPQPPALLNQPEVWTLLSTTTSTELSCLPAVVRGQNSWQRWPSDTICCLRCVISVPLY